MQKSIKRNYIFNLLSTISSLLFPIITFPYVSRILLADGIGQVNFFYSIVQYVSLLTSIGIPLYGVREIAKVRDNIKERNIIAVEILLLHVFLTIIGYIIIVILIINVSEIQANVSLFLILSTYLLLVTIGCEWFYQGVEEFEYIAIRSLVVKSISVILLFLLVKEKEDILWYGVYTVLGILGGNVLNFIRLKKFLSEERFSLKSIKPLRHFIPALKIFILSVIVSIYLQLNTIMLGFIDDSTSVGLFTAASKLSHMVLGIVTSLVTVMLPRLANLVSMGNKDEFNRLVYKTICFVMAISLPITFGLILVAKYLIPIFCGETYSSAILTLQIISPVIILIGIGNVIGTQILYPQGHENKVIISTAFGALVNVLLNILLIPRLSQNGAAISTVCAELVVTISLILLGYKYIPIRWNSKDFINYLISTLFMCVIVVFSLIITPFTSNLMNLIGVSFIGFVVYLSCLIYFKDALVLETINRISKMLNINLT